MRFWLQPATQLRLRRFLRRHTRQIKKTFTAIIDNVDKNFIGRLSRFNKVKRFGLGWLLLIVLFISITAVQTINLSTAYQSEQPVAGGVYREGMSGSFSTANPLYANGAVDIAVSRLVFAGLFDFDEDNTLRGALASEYSLSDNGKTYTVKLRPGLSWHDGKPLSADDVVFTYKTIQNADARSHLIASVRGVDITKVDNLTVNFTLSSALAAFPVSLTVGILPKHVLGEVPAAQLRNNPFNTVNPVGAGPFKWQQLQMATTDDASGKSASISLTKFDNFLRGAPKLDQFVVNVYDNSELLIDAFENREVNAVAGLKSLPSQFVNKPGVNLYDFQTTAQTMVFLNTQNSVFSSADVRKGLLLGTDRQEITALLKRSLRIVREPVLIGSFAFDPQYAAALYNKEKAITTLESAGWKAAPNGIREKNGQKLIFRLYAEDTEDNKIITDELKRQWKEIGAELIPTLQPSIYLQTNIEARNYDALLYSVSVGTDPDVYAYWHSSQTSGSGMNFSLYKSDAADKSLEAGRTRQDPTQRAARYKPFLKAWSEDVPAVPLFRPRIYYVSRGEVYGMSEHIINTDADRYYSVDQWKIVLRMVDDY